MVITNGGVFKACLSKAIEDHEDYMAMAAYYYNIEPHNDPRVSTISSKIWADALGYYDTVWPKIKAILDAPSLGGRGGHNGD